MSGARAFFRFWLAFLVGDDWRIAAGVAAVLGAGAVAVTVGSAGPVLTLLLFAALVALFVLAMVDTARS